MNSDIFATQCSTSDDEERISEFFIVVDGSGLECECGECERG